MPKFLDGMRDKLGMDPARKLHPALRAQAFESRMRAAERQEQSPAHGVPDVPRATQGWRGRGPAQECDGAAHAPELTRGGDWCCDPHQVLAYQ